MQVFINELKTFTHDNPIPPKVQISVVWWLSKLHNLSFTLSFYFCFPVQVAVSNGAALVLTVLQQWFIRLLLKSLMQLMTPEALALHQLKMPASYRRHFLVHQDHFSLRDLLSKCYRNLQSVSG